MRARQPPGSPTANAQTAPRASGKRETENRKLVTGNRLQGGCGRSSAGGREENRRREDDDFGFDSKPGVGQVDRRDGRSRAAGVGRRSDVADTAVRTRFEVADQVVMRKR